MKINWGTGITIAIIAFMVFILAMVTTMISNKKYSHDLVTEKYYQKELLYQNDIEALKNSKKIKSNIRVDQTSEGLKIYFPKVFDFKKIKGKVFLYRPSDEQLDFEKPISITNSYMLVPENVLLGGRWNMTIAYTYANDNFLFQKQLHY